LNHKPAIVIVNLGSPERPSVWATGRYLKSFLDDPFVLEMNPLLRALLVRLVIVPFRSPRTAAWYRRIWTPSGSPLVMHTLQQAEWLSRILGKEADVFGCLRYGNPNILDVFSRLRAEGYGQIVLLPLYPQYHASTNSPVEFAAHLELMQWDHKPAVRLIRGFHLHPLFVRAWAERLRADHWEQYDHILFSYHGVPEKHTSYHDACLETTRSIVQEVGIPQGRYTHAYQSRFGRGWLGPATDKTISALAAGGTRSLLVAAPSFVSDNLETLVELRDSARTLFLKQGGRIFASCESLNQHPVWMDCLASMARDQMKTFAQS